MASHGTVIGAASVGMGLIGYAVGTAVPYPGRAFSLTLTMVGITLLVIGDDWEEDE